MGRERHLRDDLPSEFQSPGKKINAGSKQVHKSMFSNQKRLLIHLLSTPQTTEAQRSLSERVTELALELFLPTL